MYQISGWLSKAVLGAARKLLLFAIKTGLTHEQWITIVVVGAVDWGLSKRVSVKDGVGAAFGACGAGRARQQWCPGASG